MAVAEGEVAVAEGARLALNSASHSDHRHLKVNQPSAVNLCGLSVSASRLCILRYCLCVKPSQDCKTC